MNVNGKSSHPSDLGWVPVYVVSQSQMKLTLQMANLSAIVWLYRGQKERFIALVQRYLHSISVETQEAEPLIDVLETTLDLVNKKSEAFVKLLSKSKNVSADVKTPIAEALAEVQEAEEAYRKDRESLVKDLKKFNKASSNKSPATTKPQRTALAKFDPLAERIRGLMKQIDLLCKLAGRVHPLIMALLSDASDEAKEELEYDRRAVGQDLKQPLRSDARQASEKTNRRLVAWDVSCWSYPQRPSLGDRRAAWRERMLAWRAFATPLSVNLPGASSM